MSCLCKLINLNESENQSVEERSSIRDERVKIRRCGTKKGKVLTRHAGRKVQNVRMTSLQLDLQQRMCLRRCHVSSGRESERRSRFSERRTGVFQGNNYAAR